MIPPSVFGLIDTIQQQAGCACLRERDLDRHPRSLCVLRRRSPLAYFCLCERSACSVQPENGLQMLGRRSRRVLQMHVFSVVVRNRWKPPMEGCVRPSHTRRRRRSSFLVDPQSEASKSLNPATLPHITTITGSSLLARHAGIGRGRAESGAGCRLWRRTALGSTAAPQHHSSSSSRSY